MIIACFTDGTKMPISETEALRLIDNLSENEKIIGFVFDGGEDCKNLNMLLDAKADILY